MQQKLLCYMTNWQCIEKAKQTEKMHIEKNVCYLYMIMPSWQCHVWAAEQFQIQAHTRSKQLQAALKSITKCITANIVATSIILSQGNLTTASHQICVVMHIQPTKSGSVELTRGMKFEAFGAVWW